MCDRFFAMMICLFLLAAPDWLQAEQHSAEFVGTVTSHVQMRYLLFTPKAYENAGGKKWPLIVYLHGGSRRGKDVEQLRDPGFGLPAIVDRNESFPFVVLSPQCPEGEYWTVDASRVYLTGHSMGGFGTWYLAYKHPEKFAAIAPMSASLVITAWASRLKEMPIWAFHGEKDNLVPVSDTQDLIDRLRALGNEVRFTVLPNRDHYILDAYENQELYSWFLQHAKK